MKNPGIRKNQPSTTYGPLVIGIICGLLVWSPSAIAEKSFRGGIDGGYSLLSTSSQVEEKYLNGGGVGFHLQFHLSESWGIYLEGDWARYPEYQLQLGQGFTTPPIRDLRHLGGAAGVLYKLDITRITPWIGLALAGLYYDRAVLEQEQSFTDVAIRLDLGADFRWTDWLEVGLVLRSDFRLTDESPYATHFGVLARATVVWTLQ